MDIKSTKKLTLNTTGQSNTTYQAGVLQAAAHRSLQKYCDEILLPFGITKMHWLITGTILDHGDEGINITDLAQILSTKLPYLTNTINLLESKGVLQRHVLASDSRSKRIVVTPDFQKKCDEIEQTMRRELRATIYQNISPEEFRTYMDVTYKLAELNTK